MVLVWTLDLIPKPFYFHFITYQPFLWTDLWYCWDPKTAIRGSISSQAGTWQEAETWLMNGYNHNVSQVSSQVTLEIRPPSYLARLIMKHYHATSVPDQLCNMYTLWLWSKCIFSWATIDYPELYICLIVKRIQTFDMCDSLAIRHSSIIIAYVKNIWQVQSYCGKNVDLIVIYWNHYGGKCI